jgi:hypothetical protein
VNIGAIIFVILVVISLDLPTVPAGVPWDSSFDASAVNYSPLVLVVGVIVAIWWQVSAKNRYKGPVRTIDEPDEVAAQPEPPAPPAGAEPTPAS